MRLIREECTKKIQAQRVAEEMSIDGKPLVSQVLDSTSLEVLLLKQIRHEMMTATLNAHHVFSRMPPPQPQPYFPPPPPVYADYVYVPPKASPVPMGQPSPPPKQPFAKR